MIRFEYICPHCGTELFGDFSEYVYCDDCNKTYETDWDYIGEADDESLGAWLTGVEHEGIIDDDE